MLNLVLTEESGAAAAARRALLENNEEVPATVRDDGAFLVSELVRTRCSRGRGTRAAPGGAGPAGASLAGGHGFRRGPRLQVASDSERRNESGGWGLFLVDQIADRWGVECTASGARIWSEIADQDDGTEDKIAWRRCSRSAACTWRGGSAHPAPVSTANRPTPWPVSLSPDCSVWPPALWPVVHTGRPGSAASARARSPAYSPPGAPSSWQATQTCWPPARAPRASAHGPPRLLNGVPDAGCVVAPAVELVAGDHRGVRLRWIPSSRGEVLEQPRLVEPARDR